MFATNIKTPQQIKNASADSYRPGQKYKQKKNAFVAINIKIKIAHQENILRYGRYLVILNRFFWLKGLFNLVLFEKRKYFNRN